MTLVGCSAQRLVNLTVPRWGYTLHEGVAYGEHARQRLDVYVPDGADEAPVVVFFYGGRWSEGSRSGYRFVGQALASRGFVAVIPDYRLYPEVTFPAFVEDGAQAVAWVRRHVERYGGDRDALFVMGHSAGAHIAAMLALRPAYLRAADASRDDLAGMIGLAGPYDFEMTSEDLREIFGPPARYPLSQPIRYADGDGPPLLLLHGGADSTVHAEDTHRLAEAVAAAGGPVTKKVYPGIGHIRIVAVMAAPLRWLGETLADVAAFVRRVGGDRAEPDGAREKP